jgi:ankyrin repeat protein
MASRNSSKDSNIETVKLLLDYKADVNLKNNDGWTSLMMADESSTEINLDVINLLIDYNSPINLKFLCELHKDKNIIKSSISSKLLKIIDNVASYKDVVYFNDFLVNYYDKDNKECLLKAMIYLVSGHYNNVYDLSSDILLKIGRFIKSNNITFDFELK